MEAETTLNCKGNLEWKSNAMMNTMTVNNAGRQGFISADSVQLIHGPLLWEIKQERKQRIPRAAHWLASCHWLIQPRAAAEGQHHPQ